MPRPQKPRSVCALPENLTFGPSPRHPQVLDRVVLTIDELETIRLIDHEGYNQEEAATQMQVARTTVQRIYNDARKKIADTIVNGKLLMIQGGEVVVCEEDCNRCQRPGRGLGHGQGRRQVQGGNNE